MPGFDGTGPMGMGPLTGRGMGFCAVPYSGVPYPAMGTYPTIYYRYPVMYGRPYFFPRRGRGWGGRGRGRGRW
ncbi:MAG TPA: hypothetical protein ENG20_05970 [Methanomicrobia archaeon]|nr:hypothetical protein [Methanomicrobia archaeon]